VDGITVEPSCKKEVYKVERENWTKCAEEDWVEFRDDIIFT